MLLSAAIGSLVLSLAVFWKYPHDKHWLWPIDAIYSAAGLLLLHPPHNELPESASSLAFVTLQTAKLLALVFAGGAAIMLVKRFFGNELRRAMVLRKGKHTVICGLDFLGGHLLGEFRTAADADGAGNGVVVIDKDIDASMDESPTGAAILRGDPADGELLRKAGIHGADRVLAATLDDAANIAVALRLTELAHELPGRTPYQPNVFVHVADPQLRTSLRRQRAFPKESRAPRVTLFNVFENSARLLLRDHPLDYQRIREDDDRAVQLVVIGFGLMGEAVLTRAALLAHYANGKPLRAIVIDRDATPKRSAFLSRYRRFEEVCEVEFRPGNVETRSAHDEIEKACDSPQSLSTVVICLDRDTRALALGLSLHARVRPDVPIRVRLNEESALVPLFDNGDAGSTRSQRLTPFGSLREACARNHFTRNDLDMMAKHVHEAHVDKRREGPTEPGDPSLRTWEMLDDDLIDSNRQFADHIPVKIRALGYHIVRSESGDVRPPASDLEPHVELLGKMEHQRWMAERLLAGWEPGPKDVEDRRSPYLMPWKDLPDDVKEYDRNLARMIPGVLQRARFEIRR